MLCDHPDTSVPCKFCDGVAKPPFTDGKKIKTSSGHLDYLSSEHRVAYKLGLISIEKLDAIYNNQEPCQS